MKLCLDLDDFSEEIMTEENWTTLLSLKELYPKLKVTMFTIPEQCSEQWLHWVEETFPWIEMCIHGTNHKKQYDVGIPNKKKMIYFKKIFKAPWWLMTKKQAEMLKNNGIKIATNKQNCGLYEPHDCDYIYNRGPEIIKDVCYKYSNNIYTWHGHVQSQSSSNSYNPNGLIDVMEEFKNRIPKDTDFIWVSEVIRNG